MNRSLMFGGTLFLCVLAVSLVGGEKSANARHGCHGCWGYNNCWGCIGGHGCWSCYGCHGCYGCYGCDGCYGCWGCHGRRRVVYRHYACSGCYGCYGCHGVYDCDGCSGCCGCYGTPVDQTPAPAQAPATEPPKADASKSAANSQPVYLSVDVPEDAKIIVNGHMTKSTGTQRHFLSRVPSSEHTYEFDVRAEIVRDGETIVKTERARLRSGEQRTLQFAFDAAENIAAEESHPATAQLVRRAAD